MRKLMVILIMFTIILSGCGKSIPKGMNERTYEIGSTALEIIHKYNKAEVSKDDAKNRIDDLSNQLNILNLQGDQADKNTLVNIQLQQFIFQLSGSGSGDTDSVEKSLKKLLGK